MNMIQTVTRTPQDIAKWISNNRRYEDKMLSRLLVSMPSGKDTRIAVCHEVFVGDQEQTALRLHDSLKGRHQSYGNVVFRIDAYYTDETLPQRELNVVVMNEGDEPHEMIFDDRITIGKPITFVLSDMSSVDFRPKTMQWNSPCPGFINIVDVKVANCGLKLGPKEIEIDSVSAFVGNRLLDSYHYSEERRIDSLEVKAKQCTLAVIGEYTGLVPIGFEKGYVFDLTITFKGTTHKCGICGFSMAYEPKCLCSERANQLIANS